MSRKLYNGCVTTGEKDKFEYLLKTLSRTKRKDYENYVVNAIWNRLDDFWVKPVTQQYINKPKKPGDKKKGYFIDLYFPQINLGIECDEPHHNNQKQQDKVRTAEIFDILTQVTDVSAYEELRIDVDTGTRTVSEIDADINKCVYEIRCRIDKQKKNGTFIPWNFASIDSKAYFSTKDIISIYDDVSFKTRVDVCNVIFGSNYKQGSGRGSTSFIPRFADSSLSGKYRFWGPKLAVDGKGVVRGMNNQISSDGMMITQSWDGGESCKAPVKDSHLLPRIVFTHSKDPVTRIEGYRFVGVFEYDAEKTETTENTAKTIDGIPYYKQHFCKRISDRFGVFKEI